MEKPQSATFTITAETPQELARLLRRIADALDGSTTSDLPAAESPELRHWTDRASHLASPDFRWEPATAGALWSRVDTSGARRALLFLTSHDRPVSVEELGHELDKEPGPALAGTLSPIGRAVSAIAAPPPYRRVRSHYYVDSDFARAFREFQRSEHDSGEADPG